MIDAHSSDPSRPEKARGIRRAGRLPAHIEAEIAGNTGEIAVAVTAAGDLAKVERDLDREIRVCARLSHDLCDLKCHVRAAKDEAEALISRRRRDNAALCNGDIAEIASSARRPRPARHACASYASRSC